MRHCQEICQGGKPETIGGCGSHGNVSLRPLVGAVFTALAWAFLTPVAHAMLPVEEARVKMLIAQVATSEGTVFIRNGREYTAAEAAEFLRRKCSWRLDDYADAEHLVQACAARSSTSGEIYRIRLAGAADARPSAEVLGRWLAALPKR